MKIRLRDRLEFGLVWLLVQALGVLPRPLARSLGTIVGSIAHRAFGRLRRVGLQNLQTAFPNWSQPERERTLRSVYKNLGRHLAEFCLMQRYTLPQASQIVEYEGLDHYLEARDRNKGVLIVTGHLGAWELSSFYHSLAGHPMGLVIRKLDNLLLDGLVNRIRCLHGNRVIDKDQFARGLVASMRAGETVGILMDTNMTPPQGVFVPYFGKDACTGSGLARIALKTDAAVVPGFLIWDDQRAKYILRFDRCINLIRTGDNEADTLANTAAFTRAIERAVRRNPDQWLWMHRRWKTRPPGEQGVY